MQVSFHGATREVTGSCYLVETPETRVLVDCGLFQGCSFCETKNLQEFTFDPSTIDAVIVSHAHLDHTGRLPKLIKDGFSGKIYATPPTAPITQIVLEDAVRILEEDFKRFAKPMLYGVKDVEQAVKSLTTVDYSTTTKIGDLSFRFRDAGHIFGSAFIELTERGGAKVAFSGDLGNEHVPILCDTAQLADMDALVMESTYGNRVHEGEEARSKRLREVIIRTAQRGGVLLIPAFAIERTQQLLFELNALVQKREIPALDIFLDSPMAIRVTEVIKHFPQYYDTQAKKLVASGEDFFDFPGLKVCLSRDDSKQINAAKRPKVIIAGSGMMNGGRILHHLVRYLGDARSTVLIIGYQAEGTLGRQLYEHERTVRVLDETIQVRAEIASIGAYSAHADQNKLVSWVKTAAGLPEKVFCTHGEEGAAVALATRLQGELGIEATVPRIFDTVKL
ncbi:MBL fold metallo-hydrolase [Patescibacteria group bacterium]|nr:MBL fold metallo-hydrolase [Patescibacteria group bacterium]